MKAGWKLFCNLISSKYKLKIDRNKYVGGLIEFPKMGFISNRWKEYEMKLNVFSLCLLFSIKSGSVSVYTCFQITQTWLPFSMKLEHP